jgi:hypothetical protein
MKIKKIYKESERKRISPNLMYTLGNCLERLTKTKSQNNRHSRRSSKLVPPE